MKKTITLFAIILTIFIMGVGFAAEQSLKVEASQGEWQKQLNKLEGVRNIVDNADLSNQQTKFIVRTIDSLEMLIVPQLQRQLTDSSKKK